MAVSGTQPETRSGDFWFVRECRAADEYALVPTYRSPVHSAFLQEILPSGRFTSAAGLKDVSGVIALAGGFRWRSAMKSLVPDRLRRDLATVPRRSRWGFVL